jgi:hypothetical protein
MNSTSSPILSGTEAIELAGVRELDRIRARIVAVVPLTKPEDVTLSRSTCCGVEVWECRIGAVAVRGEHGANLRLPLTGAGLSPEDAAASVEQQARSCYAWRGGMTFSERSQTVNP